MRPALLYSGPVHLEPGNSSAIEGGFILTMVSEFTDGLSVPREIWGLSFLNLVSQVTCSTSFNTFFLALGRVGFSCYKQANQN